VELGSTAKDDYANDTIGANLNLAILNMVVAFLTDLVAGDGNTWQGVHASRDKGVSYLILSWLWNAILDSQSTRLTGHGA
jgi:hypothetical protein